MRPGTHAARFIALGTTIVAILSAFLILVRPWYLHWGATDEEARRSLPGDDIIPNAVGQGTRAITIRAPVEQVWPWLAQLGQDRGGFYSYDLLENLVGCEMPTIDRLDPEKQAWRLGDKLWMYPARKAGGAGFATLRVYVPGRVLAFGTRAPGTPLGAPENGSWSFVLEPLDASTTRLFVRGRGAPGRSWQGTTFDRAVFEPIHFLMERRTMMDLKELAETGRRHRVRNHVQVGLWTVVFGLFAFCVAMVLADQRWRQSLIAVATAAIVFQILTLGQPAIPLSALLTTAAVAVAWWPPRWRAGAIP